MPKNTAPEPEKVYRLRDAWTHPLCRAFGLSTQQIERAYWRGDLVGYKPGLYVMFKASDLEAWIEGSRTDSAKPKRPTAAK